MAKKKKARGQRDGRAAGKERARPEDIAVPIAREFPAGQVGVAANHFVIQHDQSEFHLLFFQTHPALILGDTDEETEKAAEQVKSARSVCVARIIVSAERLPSFVRAMQENLEKHGRACVVDDQEDIEEAVARAELERITPPNAELLELADRFPAPQEWYDESWLDHQWYRERAVCSGSVRDKLSE